MRPTNVIVYDGTAPGTETRVSGPGDPTLLHAYPDNSLVSLCGKARQDNPPAVPGRHCQACIALAGQRAWVTR